MKYVVTIHFDSTFESPNDLDWLINEIKSDNIVVISDYHIEPIENGDLKTIAAKE